jgi:hypothetical protein
MKTRSLGLFVVSLAAGVAAWALHRSSLDSWSKDHAGWPLAALCVVAAAAGIYLVVVDVQRRR